VNNSNVFRKSSLERISSVDGIDKDIKIVSVKSWIVVVLVIVLMVVTLAWSVFSRISTYVEASGIMMYGSGIETIKATKEGTITDLNLDVGDFIFKSTTVARVSTSGILGEIKDISTYQDYCSQLDDFKDSNFQDVSTLSYELYSILKDDINTNSSQLDTIYSMLKNDYTSKIEDLQNDVISESWIQTSISGKILEVYKSTGDYVNVGDGIASVAVQTVGDYDRDSSINTEVIVYMPLSDGKKISKGMEVQVNPSTVDKEKYGYIVGSVKSVSEYVVSEESMMNVLNNELLVESLATDEALIEIHVELLRDNDTISGYQWTTKNGAPMSIDVGTECSVRIEVDSSRPLEIVFPFMESILDGESES
jgi:hypothetical protein